METQSKQIPSELANLIELLATFLGFWGFGKNQSRIWALLFLSAKPLTSSQISGLIAIIDEDLKRELDYLEKFQLVFKARGTEAAYSTNEDILTCIRTVIRQRELPLIAELKSKALSINLAEIKSEEIEVNRARIDALLKMIKTAENFLKALLAIGSIQLPKLKNPFSR